MCGIVGIVDCVSRREIDRGLLAALNQTQLHRGPDGGGLHVEPGVGLGHRRLAIIDVATGQQPLFNEDGTVAVVFNGEIYNYRDLIAELSALGHVFRTRSDTEVIVHAWEQWGERCVDRFRGMFAFAIWDRNRETLFLARDRLGVKPLFYTVLPDGVLVFASELKAVMAHGEVARDIDPCAIEEYLALGYVPEPRTIYRSVKKLSPGHSLSVRRGRPVAEPEMFWDVRFTLDRTIGVEDAGEELVRRLRESVRLRMISEVPLGAFLSGGVDSSAVVAAMAAESASPVKTCSISFADPAYDESAYAEQVARRYRTDHFVDQVDSDDFSLIEDLIGIYDEPYADSSALPTYRVCELARRHVTVALSGDGGDESFGGYSRYLRHLAGERQRACLPLGVRRAIFGPLGHMYPALERAPRPLRARSTFQSLARSAVEAYFHEVSIVRGEARRALTTDAFRRETGGYDAIDVFRRHAAQAQTDDPLALIQYLDLKTYLVGDINTKVDRASMAHSLEVREPLMDHPLVEWLASLPSSLKMHQSEPKWLLKKSMEPFLPHDVLYRRKMGFAVPLGRWFRGPLRARVRDSLQGDVLPSTGWFDRSALSRIVETHENGVRDMSATIWTLMMLEGFLRAERDGTRRSDGRSSAGKDVAAAGEWPMLAAAR
ncbi:MAG: amidotransferase 1, exosortase A system-associated [Betaproteobacteria bacterium]|nr:amidotransferase 1, exosortase A system-associated [Betaproteobacteria bacterium]